MLEPPELEPDELEPPELEPDELEPDEPGLVPVLPEDELPDVAGLVEAVLDEPGSASATAPAASRLATATVAVVAVTRLLARWRAATAFCFRLSMS